MNDFSDLDPPPTGPFGNSPGTDAGPAGTSPATQQSEPESIYQDTFAATSLNDLRRTPLASGSDASLDGAPSDGDSFHGASLDGESLYGGTLYGGTLYGGSVQSIDGSLRRSRYDEAAAGYSGPAHVDAWASALRSPDGAYAGQTAPQAQPLGSPPPAGFAPPVPLMPDHWPPQRPLRVAHLNAAWIPAGIENWLISLVRYADPRRLRFVRCTVLTPWADPHQIRRTPIPVTVGGGRASVASAAAECDVLIVSDPGSRAAEVARWIGEAKPPVTLFVLHGDGAYTAERQRPFQGIADHFVSVSDHVHQYFAAEVASTRIRNGVDPARLVQTRRREDNRRRLGFQPADFVVGFIGRFSPEKNPLAVVDALTRLPPHCKALLVGFGRLRPQLLEYCARYLPGRFAMVDGSELDNLGDHYGAMDALAMPSSQEGYGLVAMEAMMCGVPVITTRFGVGNDLIADRVNGIIVEPHPDSIAEAVAMLDQHRRWADGLGQFGRQTALRDGFASTMTEQYESLLARLWQAAPVS